MRLRPARQVERVDRVADRFEADNQIAEAGE
jgi:hypothetical protein